MRKKGKGFTKKKSIVLTRIKRTPKKGGVKLFKGLFTRKKSPEFFPVTKFKINTKFKLNTKFKINIKIKIKFKIKISKK